MKNHVYSTSHVLDANHGGMHLYVQRCDLQTGDILEKDFYIELIATSFTYNSIVDRRVFGIVPAKNGFYIVGKLDMPMKRAYPKNKADESFLGLWIAKFDQDLNMIF